MAAVRQPRQGRGAGRENPRRRRDPRLPHPASGRRSAPAGRPAARGARSRGTRSHSTYSPRPLRPRAGLSCNPTSGGSGGYGAAFADAGRGRWGDRMQEDVEDAVAQVLATGRADPSKVAICGASYGGYAALMGAVRRPDLYRCAVSIAGVSDLAAMLAFEREDGEDSPAYQYWVRTIGHPERDAEKLRLASPRRCAEAIKAPVLLIHGLEDQVVPMEQSRLMAQALRAAGKPVEHLEMKDVGHRGWTPETLRQIVERSAGFIAAQF
ncbi:S9 family peptidase [Phenylobacterium sp. J367]|uniref:alpha/beta hydrolase family protein n=1 Tax=Phenylobacterium sp. J367 TaxID=2898435 RepID=UPI002151D03D|nr:prolyl oligopeptidase family serine peptidase [Phenylobacterium sp. J367]MCR5878104.1 prolyl oligopeptidase family serine peptidase [Phenylobacterium sp. J367]